MHSRGTICGGVSQVSYWAEPGQYSAPTRSCSSASSVSCSLHINGQLDNADSAVAFDGHDANYLGADHRIPIIPSYPPPRVPLQRAVLMKKAQYSFGVRHPVLTAFIGVRSPCSGETGP